jgi:hypothetical protein
MSAGLRFNTLLNGTPAERMRISGAGNVGINTTSPTARLTVAHNDTTDAVRITQEGSGNALVVEDSANPDSTPLVVNSSGQIISGATTAFDSSAGLQLTADSDTAPNASIAIRRCTSAANSGIVSFSKARGTAAAPTAVSSGDSLGAIAAQGHDGSGFITGGRIEIRAEGSPSAGNVPSRIAFLTQSASSSGTPPERMRIDSAGNVGINTTTPTERLDVNGTVKATAFSGPLTGNVTGTASAIADGSVSTAKIVDANVTLAKLVTAVQNALVPAGAVQAFAMNSAPAGWLAADGSNVNRTTYAALFSAIGTTYGAGDGSTTFALPDLRGIFVRGSGSQTISGITYNKTFAAKEGDAMQGHRHALENGDQLWANGFGSYNFNVGGFNPLKTLAVLDPTTDGTNGTPRTASETRPANIALLYCIKF